MKLKDFIVCDDIRTEINYKVSIMGVYDDIINFLVPKSAANVWPKILRLGLFIRLALENKEEQINIRKLILEFTLNGEKVFHAEQGIDLSKQELPLLKGFAIPVVFNNIQIPKTGDMEISLSVLDKDGKLMQKVCYPGNVKITEIIQKL